MIAEEEGELPALQHVPATRFGPAGAAPLEDAVVEEVPVERFASPELLRHPFSRALWHALPEHDFGVAEGASEPGASQEEGRDAGGT